MLSLRARAGSAPRAGLALLLTLLALGLSPRCVIAEGTPAGTVLTNQASATFQYAGQPLLRTVNSNTLSVTIEQIAAVNLTPTLGNNDGFINSSVDYPVAVTNSGNGVDRFSLAASSSSSFVADLYEDTDGDGLLSAAEVAVGPITQTRDLAADASLSLVARVFVPNSRSLIGQTDLLAVSATSAFDQTKSAIALRSTRVTGSLVTSMKSVNPTAPRAGDRVTYTLTYTNGGNGSADNLSVSDLLDSRLQYVTGSASPAPDSVIGRKVFWNPRSIAAGGNGTIVFQADIVSNAVPGAEIHNVAELLYNDGPNSMTATSIEANFITVQSGGPVTVDFTPNQTGSGEAGDTIQYAQVITNNGILPEEFELSYTSTQGLQWAFYADADGDGKVDTSAPPASKTGLLPGGMQYRLVARAVLPLVPADQTVDFTTLRAQSTTNPENFKTVNTTTAIGIPQIGLTKTATASDPRSGGEITYTIVYTNAGHGQADSVLVDDDLPANTVYVPGSLTLNSVPKTDALDADEAVVSGSTISVRLGTLMPNSSGVIEFRVRIQ